MIDLNPSRNLAARPRACCFLVLFLVAGWLALVTPLRADNPPTYLFQIDASRRARTAFPALVALDASNNLLCDRRIREEPACYVDRQRQLI